MTDTDWGNLAETRFNKELTGLDKIKNKDDYQNLLENYFGGSNAGQALLNARRRSWDSIATEMYEGSNAIEIAAKNSEKEQEESARELAIRTELARSSLSRRRDESKTSRNTKPLTINNVLSWRTRMNKMDIRGIDTKKPKIIRGLNVKRQGSRNVIVRVWTNPTNRARQYRNIKDGRFIKYKPTRGKK